MAQAGVADAFMHRSLSFFVRAIYSFHMPLFIALSGALFTYDYTKQLSQLLVKKARRLLIPFLFAMTLVSTPAKYIAGYYNNSRNILSDIIIGQYLIQGNTHLWFLPTLFCLFIIFFLIKKYLPAELSHHLLLFGFLTLNIISSKIPVVLVANISHYLIYFYLGMIFEKRRENFNAKVTKGGMSFSALMWVTFFVTEVYLGKQEFLIFRLLEKIVEICTAVMGMISFYELCLVLTEKGAASNYIVRQIDRDSFVIYLYSDPFNYILISAAAEGGLIYSLNNNLQAVVLFVSRFIITLFISILITVMLRKFRIRYVC